MARRIARYNERITIQKNTVLVDQYKNHTNAWTDYYSCAAYVSTYQREEKENEVTLEELSVTFEVRYCSELANITSTGYRVLFRGVPFNIESVDRMNYQRKVLQLKCEGKR